MTGLTTAIKQDITHCFVHVRVGKKLLWAYKDLWQLIESRLSAWVCLCIQHGRCVFLLTLRTGPIRGLKSDHVNWFFLSGAHLGGANDLQTHTQWLKSTGIQMYMRRKKNFLLCIGLCFCLSFSPQSALWLFSQICQCHLGLRLIFYPQCLTDRGVLALWESKLRAEINPVPLAL